MAFSDYFERNMRAATSLIRGLDGSLLREKLQREVVAIAFDAAAAKSREGRAGLDLTVRLISRLYPSIAIVPNGAGAKAHASRLARLARDINPKIDVASTLKAATRTIAFCKSPLPARRGAPAFTWYAGSDNWLAKVSRHGAFASGTSGNPLGAGASACIACANVFRAVFDAEIGSDGDLDEAVVFSTFNSEFLAADQVAGAANPALPAVTLQDTHLVGVGAIGTSVIWALQHLDCDGELHIIDPECVSDSNLQRYVMPLALEAGKHKAILAKKWLSKNKELTVHPHELTWAAYAAETDYHFSTVISAVDSADARIQIQASLPKTIYNGWTQGAEAGVSRHESFSGDMACLACLYFPTGTQPNFDELVLQALKLPTVLLQQVRQRLVQNIPTESAFLDLIAQSSGVERSKLAPYEGRLLRELYVEAVCGGAVIEFEEGARAARADVPMGFQSALSGLLLAAELARGNALDNNITQINLAASCPERASHKHRKSAALECLCKDRDFLEQYGQKYPG